MTAPLRAVRVPVADTDAEAAVLSALVLNPECIEQVTEKVRASDFYSEPNQRLCAAVVDMYAERRPVDITTLSHELRARGELERVGGPRYLAVILDATPAVANVLEHAEIVRNSAIARATDTLLERERAKPACSPSEAKARARALSQQLTALADDSAPAVSSSVQLVPLSSLVGPALDRAERRRAEVERPIPVPFAGWSESLGGGLWPGAHFVVSGTAVGKSQLTIQTALAAASEQVPTAYVGLELDEAQIATRALGPAVGARWSSLYLGRCSADVLARAREAAPSFDGLSFYVDFGPPRGWPASRLYALAQAMRAQHPTGPMLLVLDYLQLVGNEPGDRTSEIRQRIADAAYATRDVARRFDAAVVVVSSAARQHYGLLASDCREAGLATVRLNEYSGPVRKITSPHLLIGLGKESGEVEFSADTVTVLIKWPAPLDNGEKVVLCAVPKVRAGFERWSALAFDGGRFLELEVSSTDELPQVEKPAKGGRPAVGDDDLESAVVATLRRIGPSSKRRVVAETKGKDTKLYAAIKAATLAGRLAVAADGTLTAAPAAQESEAGQR